MSKKFNTDRLIEITAGFVNMKGIVALKNGMLSILPLTVVGSIFLVIGQIPSEGINNAIASVLGNGWTEPFMQVYGGTFAIMGLISCFAIGYAYVKNEGYEALPAGVLSVAAFFITMRSYIDAGEGAIIDGVVEKVWFGGQGIIGAIIIGLTVGWIYSFFLRNKIVIKMPESVPEAVANQFTALVPAFAIFTLSMIIYIISKQATGGTFMEWIYATVQLPLQGLTDTLPGVLGIAFFISFFWWFGVHGQSIVNGIVTSFLLANTAANASGATHIVTQQFLDSFLILSGSGITFGLVVAMLFAAKSKQYKALGKVAAFPAVFNINEPVTFGFPIVLNPLMFLPFILVPVLAALIVYGSIAFGFVAPFSGAVLPWSTPFLISGLMVAGWQGLVLQIIILTISTVVYYPFFKKQDMMALKQEEENERKNA